MKKKSSMSVDHFDGGPEGYYEEETYSKGLNREDTIEGQIRSIVFFYTRHQWDEFEYGLKILFALIPDAIRRSIPPLNHDTTGKGVEEHYKQFIEIQRVLELDTNMIFKKKFIKTYE